MTCSSKEPKDPRQWREVLECLPVGLSVVNARLELVAWNQRFFDLLDFPDSLARHGTPFEAFIRYNAWRGEYGKGDIESQVAKRLEQARRFQPHLLRRQRPSGVVLEIRGNPLPAGGFVTTYADITERETALLQARLSEERYRRLVDLTPDAVFVHRGPAILFANQAALRLFGANCLQTLAAHDLAELVHRECRARILGAFRTLEAPGGAEIALPRGEAVFCRLDGSDVPVEGSSSCVQLGDGPAVLTVARDITERRNDEGQVRRLNESLEERVRQRTTELILSNQELESFSYSVSHDLRAPLRAIDGFSHLLQEEFGATMGDTGKQYLGRIRMASQRMGKLIDDLLDLARISRRELKRERLDLSAIAVEISRELDESAPARTVDWRIARGLWTDADPLLARLVLDNLLRNAWKFSAERDTAVIEFGPGADASQGGFFVRDNGAGFDMNYAQKLFQPFQRLHTGNRFEGTGIGLAIVHRVLRRHGGHIVAESRPDCGACFYFSFGDADRASSN